VDTEGWSATAGWVAAAVALASTVVAVWQARIARRSAQVADRSLAASLDQAHSARDSAESARMSAEATITQALAAARQVELMREQHTADVAERDRREAPEFELTALPNGEVGTVERGADGELQFTSVTRNRGADVEKWSRRHTVRIALIKGTSTYTVEVLGSAGLAAQVTGARPFRMTVGSIEEFGLVAPYGARGTGVELTIFSTEIGGQARSWTRSASVRI
jgi:hypothetical protein